MSGKYYPYDDLKDEFWREVAIRCCNWTIRLVPVLQLFLRRNGRLEERDWIIDWVTWEIILPGLQPRADVRRSTAEAVAFVKHVIDECGGGPLAA